MEERPFNGVFIPAKLYLDRNLNWNEKLILVEVQSLTTEIEPCKATNEHFANHLGISKKRVSEIINELVKKRYLYSTLKRDNDTNQVKKRWLIVNHTYSYFQGEGIEKNTDTPIPKNTEENNKYKNNYKENNNNKLLLSKKFKKPTIDEVKEYCIERNNNINPEQFIDYYESNGWKVGKNSMKDWKATVRTWERNNRSRASATYKSNYEMGQEVLRRAREDFEDEQKGSR